MLGVCWEVASRLLQGSRADGMLPGGEVPGSLLGGSRSTCADEKSLRAKGNTKFLKNKFIYFYKK